MLSQLALGYLVATGPVCLMLAAEIAFPRSSPSWAARGRYAVGSALLIVVAIVVPAQIYSLTGPLKFQPFFPSLAPFPGVAGTLIACVIALFLGDFFYYWFHRAQHTVPFLWRFHAVHHSVREMSAPAGFYHHVSEPVFKMFLYSVPLSLVAPMPSLFAFGSFMALYGCYIHSSTRLHLGPLSLVFADNRVHRIHHSVERQHFDKNFAAFTPIWDQLFGTFHRPRDQWPDVGLEHIPEPKSLWAFVFSPFTRRHDAVAIPSTGA